MPERGPFEQVGRGPLLEFRPVRANRGLRRSIGCSVLAILAVLVLAPSAWAQQVNITPETSITPTDSTTPWVFQMAIGAAVLGAIILLALVAGYLRFAPSFFGRERAPKSQTPWDRPPLLARAGVPGHASAGSASQARARQPASPAAAPRASTAVAERPAPTGQPQPATAPATPAVPAEEAEAAAEEAESRPTAPPEAEQAVQADAAGQAEAAAPEERPTAKTREETGTTEEPPAPEATAEAAQPTAEAPPASSQPASDAPAGLDQETYDRVLQEQLAKGMDRRVAEGRARAAAVVAARKKAQS